jgi:hypothetical protein
MNPLLNDHTPEAVAPETADAVLNVLAHRSPGHIRVAVAAVPDDGLAALLEHLDPSQRHGEPVRRRVVTRRRPPDRSVLDDLGELEDGPTDPVTSQHPPGLMASGTGTSPGCSVEAAEVDQ